MLKTLAIVISVLMTSTIVSPQESGDKILGVWSTEDKSSQILIIKSENSYFGKLISFSGFTNSDNKDVFNQDIALRKRNLKNLVILKNLFYKGDDEWRKGEIYDPRSGKTYKCNATLKIDQLFVRAYVGFASFGKTLKWSKVR